VTLSEGKKRRLAIAIARLRNPAFLPSKLSCTDIFVITHGLSQIEPQGLHPFPEE
jgi:hypothetical protein